MEAINAVGLTPLSVLSKRTEPRKTLSLPTISQFKNQTLSNFGNSSVSRTIQGSIVLLPSVLSSELAKALTYEEALQQSVTTSTSSTSDFDVAGVLDDVINFATENPIIIGGGLAVLAVPLLVSQLLGGGKPKAWGVETAKNAYAKLAEDADAQLVDIRAISEIKQEGSPDIRASKKKAAAIVYQGEDKPGFLNKLSLKFKEPENTTLFILDKFDGNSELVAELATANGFKAAYAIKDGVEGSRGWKSSGLPWILPKKGFSFDLSNLTDGFGEVSDFASLTLGVAAAAGLGLLAFTEVETILQVLGSAALVQFVSKKLLFAEDRKQTIQQLEEVLNTKVAAKELVGDIQQIGKALLPTPVTSKALPAPTPIESPPQKPEPIPEAKIDPLKVEEAVPEVNSVPEAVPEVNSVPKAEEPVKESIPAFPRPQSPYTNYPDLKPPSSPIPSQP
ncbi:hypothetical protein ABFS82_14G135900 [Erythranthe guttata]|uniref:Rhodanese domain-containing protein n=1 Tax=Erythranthe guttata TaxID=4155 RepID=A0A022RFB3_ERYGU|nr:PREDICTED: rhodanese-like domain-containing protein 4, chloroplastic [Erythranthe guttata]EYU38901.1 hypothetical protein MIMGU_mgv1a006323mg [Erythranthe guttata]|eukprot:XP_012835646.1 PREDICTED: rhodanese-like domain-containing protein 4, chloroplastic [Erythranthe guttata]